MPYRSRADVEAHAEGLILVAGAARPGRPARRRRRRSGAGSRRTFADYRARFGPGLRLAATHRYRGDDAKRLARLADLAGRQGLALVATNDVHHHAPDRRPLADVMTCIPREDHHPRRRLAPGRQTRSAT